MLIDWFTVVAQALNFLVLVWLMRRYLYRPIMNAIDAREELVATKLSGAEAKMVEADERLGGFNHEKQEFEAQRTAMLGKAAGEAKTDAQKIVDDATAAAAAMRAQQTDLLAREFRSLSEDLKRRTCEEVFDISRKALADLATATLEEQMVVTLDRKLRALSSTERAALTADFASSGSAPVVKSAFDLPEKQRSAVQLLLKDVLGIEGPVLFQTSPDLVSGIELSAHGKTIGWSIADYLRSLDEKVGEILNV